MRAAPAPPSGSGAARGSGAGSDSGVSFAHLFRLSDDGGLFEHARLTEPRPEHGYCVDDIARGLVVATREPAPPPQLQLLARFYLDLVVDAQADDGRVHNRRDLELRWTDEPSLEDCWGRAIWGLGTAAARLPQGTAEAELALARFTVSAVRRSPHRRAMAFAALGAAEVLTVRPRHRAARALLRTATDQLRIDVSGDAGWPWPEPRLRYANGCVPEVLLAAGSLLEDRALLAEGLALLDWLVEVETVETHLSVTPVGGWTRGEPRPGFDQQPIEVAALADACGRAYELTGERRWLDTLLRCRSWFLGHNDTGVVLLDMTSGGGCDGLERHGRNENQGAESTMALISTLQRCASLTAVRS
ncbi:hypothetical protein [uncultured Friedmanniella sp.]|uniref:hypothetical protein n=1 Tax=uncultured Friedmanniella sp. TaxID=335381 RepID=UPI0035CC0200